MSEPIVFISHLRVKEGKLDSLRQLSAVAMKRLETEKPRTLVFLFYLDDSGDRVSFVHVFADAESMDLHFQGAEERSKAAYEFLQPDGWEIYGRPSDDVIESMRQAAESSGVTLTLQSQYVAGFLRPTSG
jgi:quinol monooxygenase YgiN